MIMRWGRFGERVEEEEEEEEERGPLLTACTAVHSDNRQRNRRVDCRRPGQRRTPFH